MEYYVFAFWLGFSLIIGALGRHRNIGFLFAFLWSILLSPIIGLAITLFSKTKINHNENRSSVLNQLEQIKNLQEKGILNETQFENEKTELLNKLNNPIDESSASKRNHIIGLLLFFVLIIGSGFAIKYYIHSKHNKTEIEVIENNPTDSIQNNNSAIKTEINNNEKEYGYISGRMYYPSDGIPNSVRLIFENIETGNMVELDYSNCMDESYNYKMKLPVGAYYIFEDGFPTFVADDGNSEKSIKDNSDRKCYYTLSCNGKSNSHKKQIVKVLPNKLISDIVPCDEYYK
jgi:hypothetical protein